MSHKIRHRLLLINARMLRNIIAVIGISSLLVSCSGGAKDESKTNEDSLKKANEQRQLDSIAKVHEDSIAKVKADSLKKAGNNVIDNEGLDESFKPYPMETKYSVPVGRINN